MSDLNGFSDEDLKRELEKREKAAKKKEFILNENPDLSDLKKFAEKEKDNWIEHANCTSEAEVFMYDTVMETFYGKDFFEKIRKKKV